MLPRKYILYSLAAVVAFGCVYSTGILAADLRINNCQPTSRSKVLPDQMNPGLTHYVMHGEGWVGSIMSNFRLTLIEERYADCRISTHYTLDYDIYNRTEMERGTGGAAFYITLLGAQGQVLAQYPYVDSQYVQRGFCGYKHIPWQNGRVGYNYFDITYGIKLDSTYVNGRWGGC